MKFVFIHLKKIYIAPFLLCETMKHVSYVNVNGNKGNGFQHFEPAESENINTLKNIGHT
jgi:hypothetical protein